VSKANHIYDFVAALIHRLIDSRKLIIIENPRGSWLWELPQFLPFSTPALWMLIFNTASGAPHQSNAVPNGLA
jgi:hypothetical protein